MYITKEQLLLAFKAAFPIMLGYLGIGIPCGILSDSIGLNAFQVFLLSLFLYSGAGQFMICNLYMSSTPLLSIIASVALVNTRQSLYSISLAPLAKPLGKFWSCVLACNVTDESYGVSMQKAYNGKWTAGQAFALSCFSQSSWILATVLGVFIGSAISIPLAVAAFAMTSIFLCLLCMQQKTKINFITICFAIIGVAAAKLTGLGNVAILLGAVVGIAAGFIYYKVSDNAVE